MTRQAEGDKPTERVVPGFEQIQRAWDRNFELWTARILPGEYYVTRSDEAITTILGSCIAACMRDPKIGVGGMNHFMLPADISDGTSCWLGPDADRSTRYGSFAMECLVNDLMKLGARRERLEVKLFGGGRVLPSMTDVGARNIAFAREWLRLEGMRAVVEDVGNACPRRVVYFPASGAARVKRLRAIPGDAIADREKRYLENISETSQEHDVELFD